MKNGDLNVVTISLFIKIYLAFAIGKVVVDYETCSQPRKISSSAELACRLDYMAKCRKLQVDYMLEVEKSTQIL